MKVWRVETAQGVGPYVNTAASMCRVINGFGTYSHPGPRQAKEANTPLATAFSDGGYNSSWSFGFTSLRQYLEWFKYNHWRDTLHKRNCLLVQYEVPASDVCKGNYQLAFRKREALRITVRACNYA